MTLKQYILLAVLLLGAFASGRFLTPTKVITETKTVTVEKEVEKIVTKVNRVTVIVENKDGTKTTTITDKSTVIDNSKKDSSTSTDTKKVVENNKDSISLNMLAAADISNPTKLQFGGQISKRLIGPIEMGIWGLQTGTVGVSLGLRF